MSNNESTTIIEQDPQDYDQDIVIIEPKIDQPKVEQPKVKVEPKPKATPKIRSTKRSYSPCCEITTFKQQLDHNVVLSFNNCLNTSYDVVKDTLPDHTYDESYVEIFERGLDPNVYGKDKETYGIARSLSPKTALINKMKADIDEATRILCGAIDENNRIFNENQAKLKEQAKQAKEAKGDKE